MVKNGFCSIADKVVDELVGSSFELSRREEFEKCVPKAFSIIHSYMVSIALINYDSVRIEISTVHFKNRKKCELTVKTPTQEKTLHYVRFEDISEYLEMVLHYCDVGHLVDVIFNSKDALQDDGTIYIGDL